MMSPPTVLKIKLCIAKKFKRSSLGDSLLSKMFIKIWAIWKKDDIYLILGEFVNIKAQNSTCLAEDEHQECDGLVTQRKHCPKCVTTHNHNCRGN